MSAGQRPGLTSRGGRKMNLRHRALKLILNVGLFVLVFQLGFWLSSRPNPLLIEAAANSEPTYLLTGIDVVYPYPGEAGDSDEAGVQYSVEWSTDQYPGDTRCLITLRDADANIVAEHVFQFSSEKGSTRIDGYQPVQVNGEPVSGEGACEAGSPPDRTEMAHADYVFGDATIASSPHEDARSVISFDIDWNGETDPIEEDCSVEILLKDGTMQTEGPWDLSSPRGGVFEIETDVSGPGGIEDATVECSESPR